LTICENSEKNMLLQRSALD